MVPCRGCAYVDDADVRVHVARGYTTTLYMDQYRAL